MENIVFKLTENSEYYKMLVALSNHYCLNPLQMLRSIIAWSYMEMMRRKHNVE